MKLKKDISEKTANIINRISSFIKHESDASAIEYSLLTAMMAAAIVAATTTFKGDLGTAFKNIGAKLSTNTK